MTSGINVIKYDFTEENSVIKTFDVQQSFYKYGDKKLRKQKFIVALLNEDMEVIKEVVVLTSDQ